MSKLQTQMFQLCISLNHITFLSVSTSNLMDAIVQKKEKKEALNGHKNMFSKLELT